jgi:hypothetical protein
LKEESPAFMPVECQLNIQTGEVTCLAKFDDTEEEEEEKRIKDPS